MTDPIRRAVRTFFQAFLGSLLTSGVLSAMATDGVVDWDILQKTGVAALAAGFISLLTLVMNVLEDNGTIPSVLKAKASSGARPVTLDDAGHVNTALITCVAVVVIAVIVVLWAFTGSAPFAD